MSRLETADTTWVLEVVRGRDVGKRFALRGPSVVLGAGIGAETGIDLGEQESGGLKRMAPRQARLDETDEGLVIVDLESPGGTFVNRQRVLPGTAMLLREGDVVQLGGVQLRVARNAGRMSGNGAKVETGRSSAPAPASSPKGMVYTFASGATCRTFDDVLTLSAQKWAELREDLTSGRLGAEMARLGRADLVPDPNAKGSADERLDAWLRRLPTNRECRAELDVHPTRLSVRASEGGSTRRSVRVTNTGYGLLRFRAKVEAGSEGWIKVLAGGAETAVVETGECGLEIRLEEGSKGRKSGAVLIESNGGQARVVVEVEPGREKTPGFAEPEEPSGAGGAGFGFGEWSLGRRVGTLVMVLVLARVLEAVMGMVTGTAGLATRPLWPAALGFVGMGAALGAWWSRAAGSLGDRLAVVFSAGVAGLLLSACVVAGSRTLEAVVPGSGVVHQALAVGGWAVIGGVLGAVSWWLAPGRGEAER